MSDTDYLLAALIMGASPLACAPFPLWPEALLPIITVFECWAGVCRWP
ncbi:hypothetical protein MBH78_10655 [Oceanimonas sp. NS1]|nr:hypothetical protein [Oceanimonas sp. NS1]